MKQTVNNEPEMVLMDKNLVMLQTQELKRAKAQIVKLQMTIEKLQSMLDSPQTTIVIGNNNGDISIT